MEKEKILQNLQEIKEKTENSLENNYIGYENCKVKNVIHYNKNVELINKKTKQREKFDLCVAVIEDTDTKKTINMYYLNGENIDFTELMLKYESPKPIKDIVDKTKENEKKPKEKRDPELKSENLNELEELEKGENNKDKKKNKDDELTVGKKPEYVIQTVDLDKAYVDDRKNTLRDKLNISHDVQRLAFVSYPITENDRKLSEGITVIMLDRDGRIVNTADGKKITDILEVDDSTGDNPTYDDNTKLELGGYVERNKSGTLKRFNVKGKDNNFYLSVEQKEIGGYAELYAGRKTYNGNDAVEVQLETDNVGFQTSFEMQEYIDERRGEYNVDNINKEADRQEKWGNDTDNIEKENADGNEETFIIRENDFVPDTNYTWKQFANMCGYRGENSIQKAYEKFEEYKNNTNYEGMSNEEIVAIIEEDICNELSHDRKREN